MVLLAQELFAQGRILRLERAQPADVGPIGRAHQVGKHVDFAEDLADQRVVGGRMGERRPVAARNVALLDGVAPRPVLLARLAGSSIFMFAAGLLVFRRLRAGFYNYL